MTRRRFTEREVVKTLIRQGARIICPRCGFLISLDDADKVEREHFHELALGGKDEPVNCFYSHGPCHKIVTDGTKATTAGSSKHKIAKVKRLAQGGRKRRKSRKLQSRPFQKAKRKWPSRPMRRSVAPERNAPS